MAGPISDGQIESLLLSRDGKRVGDEIVFRCFFPERHKNGDQHPSCSYNVVKQLGVCHACKGAFNRKGAATLLGLIEKPAPRTQRKIVATYDYRDEEGTILYQVVRYEPKTFSQRQPDGFGGWIRDIKGVRRVLYRLPEIAKESDPVLVLEGEKDVGAAVEAGLAATCNAGGAGKWSADYSKSLAGREIVVVPDRDAPGLLHAYQVATSLTPHARSVRVLVLPGEGKDFHDWRGGGGTRDVFLELVRTSSKSVQEFSKEFVKSVPEAKPVDRKGQNADDYFDGRTFLPERLAEEVCSKHRFIATPIGDDGLGTRVYVYRNGAFRPGGEATIVDEAYAALGDRSNANRIGDVVKNVRISKKADYALLNERARDLVNVRNGMLDWRTGGLQPHDPNILSTIQIDADFDPAARAEPLDRFLEAVLPKDEIPVVEEFVGYLLLPDTSFNKCLVVIGEGGNGKSTLLELLMGFLGEPNISHYSLQHISEEKFSVAGLFGSLANFYDELQTKQIRDTATFKIVTGGSPLKAEDKGKAPFSFRPFCRLVFSANEMPRADDRSQAYFDRFIFIQLPNRIRGTRAEVREYAKVLLATPGVRSALLNRAVAGLRRLMTQGRFSASASSTAAIEEYRRECNSAYDFVREHCTFDDPTAWVSKQSLYDRYRAWCGENTRKAMSSRGFARGLEAMNVREVRHGEGRGWGGIGWANGGPPRTVADEVRNFGSETSDEDNRKGRDIDF